MAVQKYSPEPAVRSDDFRAFKRPQLASQQFEKPEPHQIPLKNLSSKEIKDAIAQLEAQLEDSHAIERLNHDSLSLDERAAIGGQLKDLDGLREKNLALRLAEIASDVAELERNHAMRLQTYGVGTR